MYLRIRNFNPRSHEGSDVSLCFLDRFFGISIHAPTKGATVATSQQKGVHIYFNPRSHEGSDLSVEQIEQELMISIHAPTKGATPKYKPDNRIAVFQSTLPRRERRDRRLRSIVSDRFQSTLPRRERREQPALSAELWMISIHAPTKGATSVRWYSVRRGDISIHAPTKGATGNGISDNPEGKFQSTLPRRERLRGYNHSCFFKYFNPRSHEGSDTFRTGCHSTYSHFNPRSHEGSDEQHLIMLSNYKKFQSTLPRRERRPPVTIPDHEFSISIHAPTKGATSLDLRRNPRPEDFNPRSHEGSD